MPSDQVTVALIVVNYRKSELTVGLCRSLAKLPTTNGMKLMIVDNGSTDQSRAGLAPIHAIAGLDDVEILHETTNWGYFGGARQALKKLTPTDYDFVIISNSDIEFTDPVFFTRLQEYAGRTDLGAIAPSVRSGLSGRDQNPYMIERPSASRMHFYKRVFDNRVTCFVYQMAGLLKSLAKKQRGAGPADTTERPIYAPHGSFLIFSKQYFAKGGTWEHKPFLFGEEITVGENCRKLGLKVLFAPSLVVSHIEHATMGWIPDQKMLSFQKEASTFCADTYFPLQD